MWQGASSCTYVRHHINISRCLLYISNRKSLQDNIITDFTILRLSLFYDCPTQANGRHPTKVAIWRFLPFSAQFGMHAYSKYVLAVSQPYLPAIWRKKVWPELSFPQFSSAEFSCDNWAETFLSCTEFILPQFSFGIIEPWPDFAWCNSVLHNLALA